MNEIRKRIFPLLIALSASPLEIPQMTPEHAKEYAKSTGRRPR